MQVTNANLLPRFERLEQRQLMSAAPSTMVIDQVLHVQGSASGDVILVDVTSAGITINGVNAASAEGIKAIRIDGGNGNDRIELSKSLTLPSSLYGGNGNDSLIGGSGSDHLYGGAGNNVLAGGGGDDVLVTIGGGKDNLAGDGGQDSFWADFIKKERIKDASPEEMSLGVHRVKEFGVRAGGKAAAQMMQTDLQDPVLTSAATGYAHFSNLPLFADAGPSLDDVQQGQVGDCYFLSVIGAVAQVQPDRIQESIVDLGDGTYAVQFTRGKAKSFIRVDADLPVDAAGELAFAKLGAESSMWVALMEKAYTFFRRGLGTYASIESGWMSEAATALGMSYKSLASADVLEQAASSIAAGKVVTITTKAGSDDAKFVPSHGYSVDSVIRDSGGRAVGLRLRNPWGYDGSISTDGSDDGYVIATAKDLGYAFDTVVAVG